MSLTPRAAAEAVARDPRLPPGTHERFTGFGVMGLPFRSGHCLALRCWPATTIGPAYAAVFVGAPGGGWTILTDAPRQRSCPRYLSSAATEITEPQPIEVSWTGERSLHVAIRGTLEWHLSLRSTAATRMMTVCGSSMPDGAWATSGVLSTMGAMAGPMLGVGKVRLHGSAPNGQWFRVAPRRVWTVTGSSARWRGQDLADPAPLAVQAHLADLWLPQKGIFYVGTAVFERLDPARHAVPAPA